MWETGQRRPAGTQATSGDSVSVLSVESTWAGCLSLRTRQRGTNDKKNTEIIQGRQKKVQYDDSVAISVPETSQPLQASML